MVQRARPPGPRGAVFRMVFAATDDAILLAEPATRRIVDANPAAERLFGYTRAELLRLRTADLIHAHSLELHAQVSGQPHQRLAIVGRRKDGAPVALEATARNVVEGGRLIRCTLVREITDRARGLELMEEQVTQRTKQLTALLQVSQALSGTLELPRVMDVVLDQLARVVEYTEAIIAYQDGDQLRVNNYRGVLPDDQARALRLPVACAPMFQAVLQRGGPVIISDVDEDSELAAATRAVDRQRGLLHVGSILGVPLVANDRSMGLLRLAHSQPRFYTHAHADLALAIANQASIAFENARLFDLGERRRRQLEALYRSEEALHRTLEPRDVLEALVDAALQLLDADKTSVLLWDAAREYLGVQAARGFQPETLARMAYRVGEGLSTLAAQTGEIVATEDAQTDARVSERLRAIDVAEDIHGMISVPIKLGGEVLGVLNLQYRQPRAFSPDERRLLQVFAQRASMALQNARVFEAERTTRERLDVALAAGQMGAWEWDVQTNGVTWSAQLEAIHGLAPGTFAGTLEAALADVHPDDRERVLREIAETLQTGQQHTEYRIIWPDGSLHWVEASGRVVYDRDGRIVGSLGFCQDITSRKHQEAEQVRLQARERAASEARAALEERQRLARELHDSVSQALYGIALGSQTALAALRDDHDQVAAENAVGYVHRLAEAAISEMRSLIFELRPESLEQEGLVAALERQVASVRARHALRVQASLSGEPPLPIEKKQALYRIAQESLHNAARHARARSLRLDLRQTSGHVILEVADDGLGFDPAAAYPGHLGLVSMRERAAAVGGTLAIHSAPGAGARITAELPL